MALIGKLQTFNHALQANPNLKALQTYLNAASSIDTPIYRRILDTPLGLERKFDLGGGLQAIEQSYSCKDPKNAFYESHKIYVDFQLVVSGEEIFEVGDPLDFKIKTPYDTQKDLIIYHQSPQTSKFLLSSGMLAIFFDTDIHAGGLKKEGQEVTSPIFKTVIKVPKNLIDLRF
ncbi:hypothetical protein BKH46_00340 [Helicobacter sp. 12S02634-8]|uniref:YhcH/YjgK/YiaL family protein n=1 Tax=Helicobacter sp. 12S02634-8 TaxID=1476199 RepID=UPI000BA54EA5|nr:YhcH/YjgK/YiaL family protein [Helicobacter sp. 12S02634-8]PAF48397.1 hypothetical protein BKH46_00340 [Helicobacter sp. 12S02634-8]